MMNEKTANTHQVVPGKSQPSSGQLPALLGDLRGLALERGWTGLRRAPRSASGQTEITYRKAVLT